MHHPGTAPLTRRRLMFAAGATTLVPLVRMEGAAAAEATVVLSDLVLQVGADESKRNLSWMSTEAATEYVEAAPAAAMTGTEFPAAAATRYATTSGAANTAGEFYHRATISGLAENTDYVYRVGSDAAGWSETYSFATGDFTGPFSFLFVGDPQIGASGNAANDGVGWAATLELAESRFPDAEFVLTGGDQVDSAGDEGQYSLFLAPEQLTSIPIAVTIGNHDVASTAYLQHFNQPNISDTYGLQGAGWSGGNHFFRYKSGLFISLNTNNRDTDGHLAYVAEVMAANPDATWTIVYFHHSVFSVALHAFEEEILDLRATLPPGFSELGVDLVLMGHDHHFTRCYLMNGVRISDNETTGMVRGTVVPDEGDVLYLTANSSSGSKFYSENARISEAYWSATSDGAGHPNFTYVIMGEDTITLETYDTTTTELLDSVTLAPVLDPEEPGEPTDPTDPDPTDPAHPAPPSFATRTRLSLSKRTQTRGRKPARVRIKVDVPGTTKKVRGRVKLFDGQRLVKAATLRNGSAVITLPRNLEVGKHSLHAAYLASNRFEASRSARAVLKVRRSRRR